MSEGNGNMSGRPRVCVIGAGPCGMSALYQFANMGTGCDVDVVCYEKQSTWGGLWNYTWLTGSDEYGEPCHAGMYKHLWSNGPKECLEFPDYTFEQHFRRSVPSFPPRPVLRDYLEGRWKKSKTGLEQFIKFHTVVRNVEYMDATDEFRVTSTNLETSVNTVETFSHVIVAVGIFNVPNKPSFEGMNSFNGRILHAHDFRNAEEFKGQRLLIVGASYSAEDLALQCMKFGAKTVVCTWRTQPMGFNWPQGIEERPLLQKISGNTVFFKDGTSAEFDSIILCTGYIYSFPFLESRLRLTSRLSMFPDNLYKGTLWLGGGNNKLFYIGVQDQYYTFTMFDVLALWTCRYILQTLQGEPKSLNAMQADVKKWVSRREKLSDCHDDIDFQSDFIADLSKPVGYNADATKAGEMFHTWEHHKHENVATYRDQRFRSIFTENEAPDLPNSWWKSYDDSIAAFVGK